MGKGKSSGNKSGGKGTKGKGGLPSKNHGQKSGKWRDNAPSKGGS